MKSIQDPHTLLAPIVDVQPAFNLIHVALAGEDSAFSPEARAFARSKIQEAVKIMKDSANFLDKRLKGEE